MNRLYTGAFFAMCMMMPMSSLLPIVIINFLPKNADGHAAIVTLKAEGCDVDVVLCNDETLAPGTSIEETLYKKLKSKSAKLEHFIINVYKSKHKDLPVNSSEDMVVDSAYESLIKPLNELNPDEFYIIIADKIKGKGRKKVRLMPLGKDSIHASLREFQRAGKSGLITFNYIKGDFTRKDSVGGVGGILNSTIKLRLPCRADIDIPAATFLGSREFEKKGAVFMDCPIGDCEKPAGLKCSGCLIQRYCSIEHQKLHWKEHKTVCKHLRETYDQTALYAGGSASSASYKA